MPVSLEQFEKCLKESGLISAADYQQFKAELADDVNQSEADTVARELVNANLLTQYQAARIYQGVPKGLVLGNYIVLDKLGAGGMGQVYKAKHARMDRIVAVKVLSSKAVDSENAVARFHREVKAAARLSHANIVTAYDADESDGIHYLVMEYVDGDNLATIVKQRGPLPVKEAVEYTIQATRGFEYAHQSDVTHRDIKPDNILVDKNGKIKILDMGLARVDNPLGESSDDGDSEMTQAGQIMGTINYMAPEQAMDTRSADARSDIYSLGCTLYRLLTGDTIFDGDTKMMKLVAHRETPPPRLSAARDDIPELLESVFQRMVAKNPDDRIQTMAALAEALEAAIADRPVPPKLPKPIAEVPIPPPPPASSVSRPAPFGESSISEAPPPPPGLARSSLAEVVTAEVIDPSTSSSSSSMLHRIPPVPPPVTADTINMQSDADTSTSMLESQPLAAARPRRYLRLLTVALGALAAMVGVGFLIMHFFGGDNVTLDSGQSPGFIATDDNSPPPRLTPLGELSTDLLPLIDIEQDGHGFAWTRRGSELIAPGGAGCRVAIPVTPTSGYRLEVEFTRSSGNGGVYVNLPIKNTNTMLVLKDPRFDVGGLQQVNGQDVAFNNTRQPAAAIITGRKHLLQVEVKHSKKRSQILAWLDNQPVVDWQGQASELSDPGGPWALAAADVIGLAAKDPTVFHSARALPSDGVLKRGRGAARTERSVKPALQATLIAHRGPAAALAFSPSGRHLATGAEDDKVVLWHLTGSTPPELVNGTNPIRGTTALAFATRGSGLAIGSADGTVAVRYVPSVTGRAGTDRELKGHSTAPFALQFGRDGRLLLSAASGSGVKIWSTDNGRLLTIVADRDTTLTGATYGDYGRSIRTSHGTHGIKVWQGRRNALLDTFQSVTDNIDSFINVGSGDTIACACGSAGIYLFDLQSGVPFSNLSPDGAAVLRLAASADGKTLAAAVDDGSVWVWDVASRRAIASWRPAGSPPVTVAFAPGGDYLATGLAAGVVELWKLTFDPPQAGSTAAVSVSGTVSFATPTQTDPPPQPDPPPPVVDVTPDPVRPADPPDPVETPKGPPGLYAELSGHTGAVYALAFGPKSRFLASAGEDHTARLWSMSTKQQTRTFKGHSDRVLDVTFSPDGRQLATASQDRSAAIWNVIDGSRRLQLGNHDDSVFCVAFSPDGGLLATGGKDGAVRIWHAGRGSRLRTFSGHTQAIRQVAISNDGQTLASVDLAGVLRLWNAETQKVRYIIEAHEKAIRTMCYASQGRTLATGGVDGQIKLWDTWSGELRTTLPESFGAVQSVAFTPDGRRLVAVATSSDASPSSQIKIWDVANGQPLARHLIDDRRLYATAVSSEGRLLAVAGDDGVIQVWKLSELPTVWALPDASETE